MSYQRLESWLRSNWISIKSLTRQTLSPYMISLVVSSPNVVFQAIFLPSLILSDQYILYLFCRFMPFGLQFSARIVNIPSFLVEKEISSSERFSWWLSHLTATVARNKVYRNVWFRFVCLVVGFLCVPEYLKQSLLRTPFTSDYFGDDIFQVPILNIYLWCIPGRCCLVE